MNGPSSRPMRNCSARTARRSATTVPARIGRPRDGSRIVGTVKARADAPAGGAIPWLLLTTKSSGPVGAFSDVTSIQRVNTVGGIAPTAPCTAQLIGTPARVSYTADYRFFTAR